MIKKVFPILLILIFSVACLGMTVFMPWAELGFPAEKTAPIKEALMKHLPGADDPTVFSYYVYSFFLGLAMTAAALSLNVAGRDGDDSDEKTILPIKK